MNYSLITLVKKDRWRTRMSAVDIIFRAGLQTALKLVSLVLVTWYHSVSNVFISIHQLYVVVGRGVHLGWTRHSIFSANMESQKSLHEASFPRTQEKPWRSGSRPQLTMYLLNTKGFRLVTFLTHLLQCYIWGLDWDQLSAWSYEHCLGISDHLLVILGYYIKVP